MYAQSTTWLYRYGSLRSDSRTRRLRNLVNLLLTTIARYGRLTVGDPYRPFLSLAIVTMCMGQGPNSASRFTTAVSTMYLFPPCMAKRLSSLSHCHSSQHKNTKYAEAGHLILWSQAGVCKLRVRRLYGGWTVCSCFCSSKGPGWRLQEPGSCQEMLPPLPPLTNASVGRIWKQVACSLTM